MYAKSSKLSCTVFDSCIGGIFSGTTGAIHSIVGELTDSTNQGIAFPLYDIVAAVGFIIGYNSNSFLGRSVLIVHFEAH